MDRLYLWRVSKPGHRVHIENPETARAYCQAENCSGGKSFDGKGAEVPTRRRLCQNCANLAGRNEADYREPSLAVLMGERIAETEPELLASAVILPVSPQKRPRYSEVGKSGAVVPKLWKRKQPTRAVNRLKGRKPKRSAAKYPQPFDDPLPW